MSFVHSIWTAPMKNQRWEETEQFKKNVWLFAYSVACLKNLGVETDLYTDKDGKDIFGFLPYNKIHTTLENFNVDKRFWAAFKIETYKHLKEGDIHIDGDVFLLYKHTLEQFKFDGYDAIFQHQEPITADFLFYQDILNTVKTYIAPPDWFYENNLPYNCGCCGFNNQQLKHKYIDVYFSMLEKISSTPELQKENCVFDLYTEQWLVSSLMKKNNAKIKTFFKEYTQHFDDYCKMIGYIHYVGRHKYKEDFQIEIRENLKKINPKLYDEVLQQVEKL